jgi:YHS domain-containing protein
MKLHVIGMSLVLPLAVVAMVLAAEKPAPVPPTDKPASDKPATDKPATDKPAASQPAGASNKKCPVSGDDVDPKGKTVIYKGKVIGFCCDDCVALFNKNPEKYADKIK